jgi:hypothetical protein
MLGRPHKAWKNRKRRKQAHRALWKIDVDHPIADCALQNRR